MFASLETLHILATLWLIALLIWISATDIAEFRIPDLANGLLVISGLALASSSGNGWPLSEGLGAVLGFTVFAVTGEVFFRSTGEDGLGLGDAKLLGAAGAWLGWQALPGVVAISALCALVYALVLRRRKLAFGPWLSASFLLHWVMHGLI